MLSRSFTRKNLQDFLRLKYGFFNYQNEYLFVATNENGLQIRSCQNVNQKHFIQLNSPVSCLCVNQKPLFIGTRYNLS